MNVVTSPHDIGENKKYAKRLFNEEKFDLIHMHLKQGENVSTHHAKTDVIIIVRTGKVEFDIEGEQVVLTNENILYLDPYEVHSLYAVEETDLIIVKVN